MDRLQQLDHDLRETSERLDRAEERGDYQLAAQISRDLDRLQDDLAEAVAEQDEC